VEGDEGDRYVDKGVRKTGYYNKKSRDFVAARGKKVFTVFKADKNYINNLVKRKQEIK